MANTIKVKRSAVQGKVPTTTDLALGELALNTYDGKLFIKKNNGTDAIVEIGGGASVTVSATAPASPNPNSLWWDSTNGTLKIYYNDGSTSQWVDASPAGTMIYPSAGIAVSDGTAWGTSKTAPSGAIVGTTDTQTLTNKRVNPRVSSAASITSPLAINSDNFDQYVATAQAADFTINADAGTPVDGQKMVLRVDDNGTPRTITFTGGVSKGFRPIGVTLTASGSNWTYATTAAKTTYFGCIYNAADARWDIIALSKEA